MESDQAEAIEAQEAAEADLEAARERVGETNERIRSLRDRRADLDDLEAAIDAHEAATDTIERLSERLDELADLEAEREDRLAEVDDRIAELEADLESADADELATEREDVLEELESVTDRIEAVSEERDRLTERIGSVRTDIEQLEDLEDRREAFTDEHEALSSVESEAAELGELYADVKASLRERNVTTLERLLNDTFDLLYRNEAYDRIDLSPKYELAVEQKDGTELEPIQLSGGERAIFNLSLRCGIYRLLAEGVEGTAPLPPLMLDEPTVFLDEGHVGQLVRLFEALREMGVEQTLVVSHHEALLDAAEHRVAVEKDPTTNRSTVEVLEAAPRP